MSERPFARIYFREMLADTSWMSTETIGAYSLLLFALWNGDGHLPDDEAALARIARVPVGKWREIWADLQHFFYESGGRLTTIHVKKWMSKSSVLGRPSLSAAERTVIFDRDGECCRYCGSTEGPFHVDHVVPLAKGGSNAPSNLVIACAPCNLSKGAKALEEWRR